MTRNQFIYALTACGCLLKDGKTWYEHDELIKCFEDLGLLEQEPRKGHWIVEKGGSYLGQRNGHCSNCRDFYSNDWNVMKYCPNCGAKMVEPQESEDKE